MAEEVAADVMHLVAGETELARATRTLESRRVALTLLFSAKESYYKALSSRLPGDVGFLDAELDIGAEGSFDLIWKREDIRLAPGLGKFFWLDRGTLLTLVTIPPVASLKDRPE